MDYIEGLGKQLSELTMYDVRSAYASAKAMVLNLSETEKMVSEATNNEAWGASSTLMQQIAQGTFNYAQFNEIMPAIYRRFTDLDAAQWRQVYKGLTLLEYLVKNGSERVVDDARQHLSLIKILRNFHFIDEKGKDQGINVRNRSKELAELLQDLDKVRQERRKAKQNRNKYQGISNESGGFSSSGGSRYGGFGSESGGGGSSSMEDYGSSSRGGGSSGFRDTSRADDFDEYDAGDDDDRVPASRSTGGRSVAASTSKAVPPTPKSLTKPAEVNLFDFDDDEQVPAPVAAAAAPAAAAPSAAFGGDDDFDDFQAAAPAPVPAKQQPPPSFSTGPISPASSTTSAKPNFFDMVSPTPSNGGPRSTVTSPPVSTPRYGGGLMSPPLQAAAAARPSPVSTPPIAPSSTTKSTTSGGGFDDLWNLAGGTTAAKQGGAKSAGSGMSMASLAQQQRTTGGIWQAPPKQSSNNNGFDDLLM